MALQKLGRYEIIDELGKGAMGLVYLARDPLIGRQLAIKTFNVGLSAGDQQLQQFRDRFLQEAKSAGILNHPNIVTIHDVVVADDGAIFIAMEYVKGTDLKILMQRQSRLDVKFVVDVVAQVAEGLDYAHSKRVVHRDIKPANVILTAEKQAKITDFGIARLDTSDLTAEGQLLGTPNYMSPEMIRGEAVDHRADIFSLGVMLYEMLTRKKPFHGNNLTVVTHKIVNEAFTPPDEIVAGLPPELLPVLDRSLAKNPDERYQKAGEMAADLRAILSPGAVPATRSTVTGSFLATGPAVATPGEPAARPGMPPTAVSPSAVGPSATPTAAISAPAGSPIDTTLQVPDPVPARSSRTPWILGGAMLLLVALAGTLAILMGGGGDTAPPAAGVEAPSDDPVEARYQPHVDEGQRLLADGDPRSAVAAFDKALALVPQNREIRQLRQQAEEAALRLEGIDPQAIVLERRLAETRQALAERDYTLAIRRAREALEIDDGNADARALLADAEEGQKRRDQVHDRFRGGASESAGTPAAGPSTAPPRPAGKARLKIDFRSEFPKGRITIFSGQERLYQESFAFGDSGRSRRPRPVSGRLSAEVEATAGETKLLIYCKLDGIDSTRRAEVPANLQPGVIPTLEVILNAEGRVRASLK